MVKKILIVVATIIVLLLGYAAVKSPDYKVSRQVTINASAEKIYPYLSSVRLGEQWGPWKELDPESKMTISGPEEGVGAKTSWTGGKQMGTGSATIVNVIPNQRVDIKIEYTDPMDMVQDSVYLIEPGPNANASIVTWTVTGKNNFMGRLMCLFADMDKMVGGMFEKGLSKLKELAEK